MLARPRFSVFIAASVDGFIARLDGDVAWLDRSCNDGSGPGAGDADASEALGCGRDCGYTNFMASIDTLVMGRKTFEKVLSFPPPWPYGSKRVVVLSSRAQLDIPSELRESVSHLPGELSAEALAARLTSEFQTRHAYVDGGVTIQRLLRAGMIDDMVISRIPVLLGAGLPLFASLPHDVLLHHERTVAFPNGIVQSTYRVLDRESGTPQSPSA